MSAEASIPSFTSLTEYWGTVYETQSTSLVFVYGYDIAMYWPQVLTVTLKRRPRAAGAVCHLDKRLCREAWLTSNGDRKVTRYVLYPCRSYGATLLAPITSVLYLLGGP